MRNVSLFRADQQSLEERRNALNLQEGPKAEKRSKKKKEKEKKERKGSAKKTHLLEESSFRQVIRELYNIYFPARLKYFLLQNPPSIIDK